MSLRLLLAASHDVLSRAVLLSRRALGVIDVFRMEEMEVEEERGVCFWASPEVLFPGRGGGAKSSSEVRSEALPDDRLHLERRCDASSDRLLALSGPSSSAAELKLPASSSAGGSESAESTELLLTDETESLNLELLLFFCGGEEGRSRLPFCSSSRSDARLGRHRCGGPEAGDWAARRPGPCVGVPARDGGLHGLLAA